MSKSQKESAEVKGILKNKIQPQQQQQQQQQEKSGGIKWDEDNLELTSIDRGTRMKIDEPKTPFVRGSAGDISNSELLPIQLNQALMSATYSNKSDGWASTTESEPEDYEEKKQFEKKRAMHYNMKFALQQAKELLNSEDGSLETEEMAVVSSSSSSETK
jgi:protein phosphatase inhibitor 2